MNDRSTNGHIIFRANMLTIRETYNYLAKNNKLHESHYKKSDDGYRTLRKRLDEILGISQQTLNRIFNSDCSSRIKEADRKRLANELNVKEELFSFSYDKFIYEDILWKKYFSLRPVDESKKREYIGENVSDRCKNFVYGPEDDIYRIWYYLVHGDAYRGNAEGRALNAMRILENIKSEEWKSVSIEALEKIIPEMDNVRQKLHALHLLKQENFF